MISLELFQYRNSLFGSVQAMDEKLRNAEPGKTRTLHLSKDFLIKSADVPLLHERKLYVWGNERDHDQDMFLYTYKTRDECVAAGTALIHAINDLGGTIKKPMALKTILYKLFFKDYVNHLC